MNTKTKIEKNFSQPFKFGEGYVVDEYRGDAAFRSHILPTKQAARNYRADAIREALEQAK